MDIRYPTGRYEFPEEVTSATRAAWIEALRAAPQQFRDATSGLTDEQLNTPYREQGWSTRQIVHHVADSHLHSYVRCKWTLTEDTPTIKAYSQTAWAETPDNAGSIESSLDLLDGLHRRWADLLDRFQEPDWQKSFVHPESGRAITLEWNLGLYAWHGRHHAAQIEALRERQGW